MKELYKSKYDDHLKERLKLAGNEPVEDEHRSCNDICCLVTLIILMIGTFTIGGISLSDNEAAFQGLRSQPNFYDGGISTNAGLFAGMLILSIAISAIYMIFLICLPRFAFFFCLIFGLAITITLTALGFVFSLFDFGIVMGVIFLGLIIRIILAFRHRQGTNLEIELVKLTG